MALKFKCDKCGAEIITKYLKLGEEAKCRSCGAMVKVPVTATGTEEAPDWIRRRDETSQPEIESPVHGTLTTQELEILASEELTNIVINKISVTLRILVITIGPFIAGWLASITILPVDLDLVFWIVIFIVTNLKTMPF